MQSSIEVVIVWRVDRDFFDNGEKKSPFVQVESWFSFIVDQICRLELWKFFVIRVMRVRHFLVLFRKITSARSVILFLVVLIRKTKNVYSLMNCHKWLSVRNIMWKSRKVQETVPFIVTIQFVGNCFGNDFALVYVGTAMRD